MIIFWLRRVILPQVRLDEIMASFTVEDFSLRRLSQLQPDEIAERYREIGFMTRFGGF